MKTVTTLIKPKPETPKTPGGISKSLLTPCRRVGLSRNWKKSGASPFQSPATSNTEKKGEIDQNETRKRKESMQETPHKHDNVDNSETPSENSGVNKTPSRNVELPRRKKFKTLMASINKAADNAEPQSPSISSQNKDVSGPPSDIIENNTATVVSTPVHLKSKSKSRKKLSPSNSTSKVVEKENLTNMIKLGENKQIEIADNVLEDNNEKSLNPKRQFEKQKEIDKKSPNELTKECIVVIQKKIFKKELKDKPDIKETKGTNTIDTKQQNTVSQTLFESDSDDLPLCQVKKEPVLKDSDKDDDFSDTYKAKRMKIEKTASSKTNSSLKTLKPTNNKNNPKAVYAIVHKPPNSQSSVDDDDDFFEKKRTIIIRKTYDKTTMPQKAKSTGSITQKDIDDLKARIEAKKKLLLARALTEDTKELRDLIKKWQKGCQDALMELMDLMKAKCPDKQNMDYSEILQSLNIPASLVGYDSDNDCFLTPKDENIVLANLKD